LVVCDPVFLPVSLSGFSCCSPQLLFSITFPESLPPVSGSDEITAAIGPPVVIVR
jgi:hypothetical protein